MTIARNWWGAAFIEKIERLTEPRRFQDGGHYARANRVQQLRLDDRTISARVQGSRETPYTVRITFDPFTREQWDLLVAALPDPGSVAASLRSGTLPLEFHSAFAKAGLRFMPERYKDLHIECACPDWLKPCKHIAAVWLQFAREFDRDPFIQFQLRGLKRDEVLSMLSGAPREQLPESEPDDFADETPPVRPEPLPHDPGQFWAAPPLPDLISDAAAPRVPEDDVLVRLGPAPFSRKWKSLETQLIGIYDEVFEIADKILRE
jgi:uncharacterized Zn finger protein